MSLQLWGILIVVFGLVLWFVLALNKAKVARRSARDNAEGAQSQ